MGPISENQFNIFVYVSLFGGILAFGTLVVLLFVENRTILFEYEYEHAQLKSAKESAEVQALQAQINPHFLYNTLSSFIAMIRLNRSDDALLGLYSLARLLRHMYNSDTVVTIADEINYAKHYLQIQTYRYPDKLFVSIDVDERVSAAKIPAMTLQPLVENTCLHVVEKQSKPTELTIRGQLLNDGVIRLEVIDNGPGIPDSVIHRVLAERDATVVSQHGIGLQNVHRRLQLYFGEEYGLVIERRNDRGDHSGTVITCTVPYWKEGLYEGRNRG